MKKRRLKRGLREALRWEKMARDAFMEEARLRTQLAVRLVRLERDLAQCRLDLDAGRQVGEAYEALWESFPALEHDLAQTKADLAQCSADLETEGRHHRQSQERWQDAYHCGLSVGWCLGRGNGFEELHAAKQRGWVPADNAGPVLEALGWDDVRVDAALLERERLIAAGLEWKQKAEALEVECQKLAGNPLKGLPSNQRKTETSPMRNPSDDSLDLMVEKISIAEEELASERMLRMIFERAALLPRLEMWDTDTMALVWFPEDLPENEKRSLPQNANPEKHSGGIRLGGWPRVRASATLSPL